ncbi:hypothetical protein [Porphyromonas sp.]|uniref:hypothetical protein n=1 Tax=Porphyromonas sp. TaxID=1924944 RepID=UPI0026DB0582|nr:hypothetical protein [Porphyromonas sp.]MDO4771254.1 hypothetical protein [Porphyromonas sp.]
MITLVYIVMLLCILAVSAKLSLLDFKTSVVYGILFLIFSWLAMPYAITSSRNEIASYLSSYEARQYVAILVTVECAIAIAFAFRKWHTTAKDPERESRWHKIKTRLATPLWWIQKYYVSLLILPTLFFIQTQVIYALPGVDFKISALIVGVGALLFVPFMSQLFKWTLPLRNMREELVLSLSILLCLSALFSTNTEEMLFAPSQTTSSPFMAYLLALIVFLIFFGVGLLFELRKKYKTSKRHR